MNEKQDIIATNTPADATAARELTDEELEPVTGGAGSVVEKKYKCHFNRYTEILEPTVTFGFSPPFSGKCLACSHYQNNKKQCQYCTCMYVNCYQGFHKCSNGGQLTH